MPNHPSTCPACQSELSYVERDGDTGTTDYNATCPPCELHIHARSLPDAIPVQVGEEVDVEILTVGEGGPQAVGKVEGFVVLVPPTRPNGTDVQPGDHVRVRIKSVTETFARSHLVTYLGHREEAA